jgi:hypothetical protein
MINGERSMNNDFHEGSTDGVFKKLASPNRGGKVEMIRPETRAAQLSMWTYGLIETPNKFL